MTYDRALRAGVLPNLGLAVIVALFWSVGQLLSRLHRLRDRVSGLPWPSLSDLPALARAVAYLLYGVGVVIPAVMFALGFVACGPCR